MSVERLRRYYLLKSLAARLREDDVMANTWLGKQLAEPGIALAADFPFRSRLVAVGYSTLEDVDGASVEELQLSGFTPSEAAAVIAAI